MLVPPYKRYAGMDVRAEIASRIHFTLCMKVPGPLWGVRQGKQFEIFKAWGGFHSG
jgi:hypothetical protein